MNKGDIINEVAKATCSKAEAGKAVKAFLETIKKALKKGDKVTLIGFGTFSVVKRFCEVVIFIINCKYAREGGSNFSSFLVFENGCILLTSSSYT
ncbi:MAG: HU family DNA-binding protein [Deltaproteobacteria bacterium]|nr:HU family DNA-binding protein [Deltaproteobacteria bacterium]